MILERVLTYESSNQEVKNIEVTDALRAYIEKRLSKLTRYFDDELNAQAVLSVVKDKSTIELTCFVDKSFFVV